MSTSSLPVYTGPWIDFTHNAVQGATITLTTRGGSLLTSFLTFYVTIAGAMFWKIVAFTYHHIRAGRIRQDQDGLWNQQQVILRNTGSSIRVAGALLQSGWAWRKVRKGSFRSSLLGVCLALITALVFAVAGIFASEVTKSASADVLLNGDKCGYWQIPAVTEATNAEWQAIVLQDALSDAQYARDCYGASSNPLECAVYTNTTISYTVNANATCPFASGMCFFSDSAAYEMDTGYMDSNHALGLNAPKSERVYYRKVTTCAPIHAHGFTSTENRTVAGTYEDTVIYLNFGPQVDNGQMIANYTWSYNEHTSIDGLGYGLEQLVSMASSVSDAWAPIPELNRTDADVTLFVLAQNSVWYEQPVNDPFFSAHSPANDSVGTTEFTYYNPDFFFNTMACIDQHQICNPNNDDCTSLTGGTIILDEIEQIGLSELQVATAGRIGLGMPFDSIYYSTSGRGASALQASLTCFDNEQQSLPNNQWQIEVESWYQLSLARWQKWVVDFASGNWPDLPDEKIIHLTSLPDKIMCQSQKIKAGKGYLNFSLLGVATILVVGAVFIVLGLTIAPVVHLFEKWLRPKSYGALAWAMDDQLQLQRMAFEGAQWHGWEHCKEGVPVTTESRPLGRYGEIGDRHPTIVQPSGSVSMRYDDRSSSAEQVKPFMQHEMMEVGSDPYAGT